MKFRLGVDAVFNTGMINASSMSDGVKVELYDRKSLRCFKNQILTFIKNHNLQIDDVIEIEIRKI